MAQQLARERGLIVVRTSRGYVLREHEDGADLATAASPALLGFELLRLPLLDGAEVE